MLKADMKRIVFLLLAGILISAVACTQRPSLKDTLEEIVSSYPGEIGIAVLTDTGDTITVNNEDKYPLMSVFKLHQAVAMCHYFEQCGNTIDSVVLLDRGSLNPNTWSPMLREHDEDTIVLPISELMRYTLMQSDNNASNYLFENIESVADVDSFIATLIPRESFRLLFTEEEMWKDHSLSRSNRTSPAGAAILMNRVFTDSILSPDNSRFIRSTLLECRTGYDRIAAPLSEISGVKIGHKTGSGYRDGRGRLMAHNDVAFVSLPGGRYYTLAVFVTDFDGTEDEAALAIANVSAAVYAYIKSYYEGTPVR